VHNPFNFLVTLLFGTVYSGHRVTVLINDNSQSKMMLQMSALEDHAAIVP